MFCPERMEAAIKESGIKYSAIAKKLNIADTSFRNKRKGLTEFTQTEISAFCELLGLSDEMRNQIFFA